MLSKYPLLRSKKLAHLEMVGTIDHGVDVYPVSADGVPFTAAYITAKGDPIANLQEDLAAEQKARATYEKLIVADKL